jgi:hypothetical protein
LNKWHIKELKIMKRQTSVRACIATLIIGALVSSGAAQESNTRPRQTEPRQGQKPADAQTEKADAERPRPSPEEALRLAISGLANQIGILTSEVRRLRQETERNSATMELLLYEERLARVEEKLQDAIDYKMQLDAREQDIQRRQRNIQQEVTLRGGLRRDEVEAALRADLQRAAEDIRTQQSNYQQRIAELQVQADRLRRRVEALRKKLEGPDEKTDKQK